MPHIAALLGVNQVSDIMSVENSHTFKRPVYAGNAVAIVEAPGDSIVVATVRIASYGAVGGGNSAPIESAATNVEIPSHTRFIELQSGASDRPDLQTATKVVSGGRALGSADNFDIIYKLHGKNAGRSKRDGLGARALSTIFRRPFLTPEAQGR